MVGVGRVGWAFLVAVVALTSCGGSSVRRNEDGNDETGATNGDDDGDPGRGGGSSVGGTAGTSGRVTCERALPDSLEVGCDYRAVLGAPGVTGYCFKGGCHNATTRAGALDLTPDDYLISRLLDVPARHEITCPGGVACDPTQATCSFCADCQTDAVLVDTGNPESSWVLRTMDPFIPGTTTTTLGIGCGNAMPTYDTVGTASYTQAHKDCLRAFFLALARTPGDWPCVPN